MIVERVEQPTWLSNSYLIADEPGGHGVIVDSNGLSGSLLEIAARENMTITHVLLTHGHADHAVDIETLAARLGVPLLAHPAAGVVAHHRLSDGETIESGSLTFRALYTPGHCADHIAFAVRTYCVTADVLFKGTVGGTSGPDGDLAALRRSIVDVLLPLEPATIVLPGHRDATSLEVERATNPFIRAWLDGEGLSESPCRVSGADATLLLWADDYDGGHKALVRFPSGEETIVGGSRVERLQM